MVSDGCRGGSSEREPANSSGMEGGAGRVSGAASGWSPDIEIVGRLGKVRSAPEEAKDELCLGTMELRLPADVERGRSWVVSKGGEPTAVGTAATVGNCWS